MQTAVLFDLDGVIIDTEGQYTTFWEEIGRRDFPKHTNFAKDIKGHTLKQILSAYYPNNPTAQQRVVDDINRFESKMDFPLIKGAVDFVKALRKANILTAVVTSSNQAKMQVLSKRQPQLLSLFDHVFTAENTKRSKPAPDCYLNAAAHFGLKATDCFVFEDSISGLQAGRDSGATIVALTTSNPREVVAPYAKLVINDFTEITVAQMCQLK